MFAYLWTYNASIYLKQNNNYSYCPTFCIKITCVLVTHVSPLLSFSFQDKQQQATHHSSRHRHGGGLCYCLPLPTASEKYVDRPAHKQRNGGRGRARRGPGPPWQRRGVPSLRRHRGRRPAHAPGSDPVLGYDRPQEPREACQTRQKHLGQAL